MPSRYEPCGIAQMIAMRYGCVPVAHETGGLADTVRDPELGPHPTGILFAEASASSLAFGMRRALSRFAHPESWRALQITGMREDFSWHRSAREYLSLYERLAAARAKGDA
jgi:starch synthase